MHEPGCVVRGDWERYPFYLELLEEVKAKDERERHRSAIKKVSCFPLSIVHNSARTITTEVAY